MARKSHPWFRKSDGWWYIKINGKQVKLARGRDAKEQSIARWHEVMAELAANPPLESGDVTVAAVIDAYLAHIARRRSPRTLAECKRYLQRFAEACGFLLVRECKGIHLTEWLDQHPEWKSDWTIATAIEIVQRPFNWATRQELIRQNPFRAVKHRRGAPRRAMTDAEFRELLRATRGRRRKSKSDRRRRPTAGERFRHVLWFLMLSGARPGEMAALTWADVDFENGIAVLRQHKTARTQARYRPRVIVLAPQLVKLLRRIKLQQAGRCEFVFTTSRNTPWTRHGWGLRMRRLRERAGISKAASLGSIRHLFGTKAIMNGLDLKTLSLLMGHQSTRMTEFYLAACDQHGYLAGAIRKAIGKHPGA